MAKRSFAVIGLGRFGAAMATTLAELGHDVIGVDGSADRVRGLADLLRFLGADKLDARAVLPVALRKGLQRKRE